MTKSSPSSSIRLGIIGLGFMGTIHAKNILAGAVPGLELVAVADIDPVRLEPFESVKRFDNGSALIASGLLDAVLIATPHYSHTTFGIEVLDAGLHLLVEKPISVHKQDCEKLIAAHRPDSGQVFAAMFNQRTDLRYRKLKDLIRTGALGKIQRINWAVTEWFRTEMYYQNGGWRATWAGEGGGVLLNQSPHNLDLWQWLFGMPERVIARCQIGRFHNIEVEDSVSAIFEYASGVQGIFVTTTGEAPGTNRLEVAGEFGNLVICSRQKDIEFTRNESSSWEYSKVAQKGYTPLPTWNVRIPVSGKSEGHVGILKNFVAAIRGEAELIAPASEGINSVELANAMLLSSYHDRPVSLPMDSAEYAGVLKKRIDESTFVKKTVKAAESSDDFSKSF